MIENIFENCEKQLTDKDLALVEQDLSIKLPDEFKAQYVRCNGGKPKNTVWVDPSGEWEPVEVRTFLPMRYREKFADDPKYTIDGISKQEWAERVLARSLMLFAVDWGGNYFCIDHTTGKIYYTVRDTWDDDLSPEENFEENTRFITDSIGTFVSDLKFNDGSFF